MSPSAEWHARLGPLEFSVGIRRSEIRGAFPERPRPLPDAAAGELPRPGPAPAGPTRAPEDGAPDREPEGGASA